jgi:hypothetical protein
MDDDESNRARDRARGGLILIASGIVSIAIFIAIF